MGVLIMQVGTEDSGLYSLMEDQPEDKRCSGLQRRYLKYCQPILSGIRKRAGELELSMRDALEQAGESINAARENFANYLSPENEELNQEIHDPENPCPYGQSEPSKTCLETFYTRVAQFIKPGGSQATGKRHNQQNHISGFDNSLRQNQQYYDLRRSVTF